MSSFHQGLLALALTVLSVPSAHAAVCGDDVAGVRVACGCGDIVVSDTRLRIDDPIAMGRCESDGLLIRAAEGAESIGLDLAGLSIQGSGAGTGIKVVRGGRQGATITGDSGNAVGQVIGFRTGISARGKNTLASLSNVEVESSTRTGVAIDTNSAVLVNVTSLSNAGDGARLGGRNIDARGLDAHLNGGDGIVVTGRDHRVRGSAGDNAGAAVSVRGHAKSSSIEVSK